MTQAIEIRLFGAFRQYHAGASLRLELPESATVAELRQAFGRQFDDANARSLLKASAFATDEAVLDEDDTVPAGQNLSILPPVCGG